MSGKPKHAQYFQYTPTRLPADQLYKLSPELTEGATLYVATDERDKDFFNIFKEHYDVVFMDDFLHVIKGVDTAVRTLSFLHDLFRIIINISPIVKCFFISLSR